MSPTRSWKRSISLAAAVAVACTALQAATSRLELPAVVSPTVARDVRLVTQTPRAGLGQPLTGGPLLRAAGLSAQADRAGTSRGRLAEPQPMGDIPFDPWALLIGALSVMFFVAGRRRAN